MRPDAAALALATAAAPLNAAAAAEQVVGGIGRLFRLHADRRESVKPGQEIFSIAVEQRKLDFGSDPQATPTAAPQTPRSWLLACRSANV